MRRTLVTAFCVVALLTTAGCAGLGGGGGPTTTEELSRAERIQQDSTDAMRNADSYRVAMEMEISTDEQTIAMTNRGVYDREAQRARMNTSVYGTEVQTYLDGSTMYVHTRDRWVVRNVSERNLWEEENALAKQRDILASSEVTVTGTETLNGTTVTVLRVEPDPEKLKDLLAQQQGQRLDGVSIEDVTYHMYVVNETNRLRKMEMQMSMDVNGQSAEADMTARYFAYDEPVDVTIPDAARAAGNETASASWQSGPVAG